MSAIERMSPQEAKALIAKLTDRELEALALVANHQSSKQIAIRVGIGVPAVDARIKNATRKLGVEDRRKAAEIYDLALEDGPRAAAEAPPEPSPEPYGFTPYQSPELVPGATPYRIERQPELEVHDFHAEFRTDALAAADPAAHAFADVVFPSEAGARNQLNALQRVSRIAAIAIGAVLALGGMISAMNGLVQIVTARGQLL